MNYSQLSILLLGSLSISGCTPLGAVSMLGSTISRTVEKEQRKKVEEPVNRRIAFTNVNLGVEYMRQRAYDRALAKFSRAVDADPKYALTYNMLGVLYQILEDPVEAENNFRKSLKLAPEDPSTLNNYGQFLCRQDRQTEAEENFLAAADNPFNPMPELAYANAGSCAFINKQTDVAIKYFQQSLSNNPDMPVALHHMAEINFDNGEYATARDYMDRYLKFASHTPRTLWLGIRIERHFDDVDKLASYSLLLRNQYPDTVEAELLRISDEYISTANTKKLVTNVNNQYSDAGVQKQISNVRELPVLSDNSGLLGAVDLSFYPLLLEEKDLLDIE